MGKGGILLNFITVLINKTKHIANEASVFLNDLYKSRRVISNLTKRDFTSKYIKNFFGLLWAIIDPLAFVLVLFFVFGMRFGEQETQGVPFIIYLIIGYIAYDFFGTALSMTTDSIKSYSYMVTKVNFRLSILPIVRLLSSLLMHIIILFIILAILIFSSICPTWYWIQIIYYIFAMLLFLLGLAWTTSSISLFFPDLKNIISIIVRLLFFLTPIFYSLEGFSEKAIFILKLNPLFYIVNGYRESLIYKTAFWEHPLLTIYFWSLTFIVILAGIIIFRKLRPHFADVI